MKAIATSACAIAIVIAGCSRPSAPPSKADDPRVHKLVLPSDLTAELPPGEGRAELFANCLTCHSSQYVANQPKLPRKTWQAEVDKMKSAYGAPISSTDAPKIVDYLATTHGSD
jgi:hypothetical protein